MSLAARSSHQQPCRCMQSDAHSQAHARSRGERGSPERRASERSAAAEHGIIIKGRETRAKDAGTSGSDQETEKWGGRRVLADAGDVCQRRKGVKPAAGITSAASDSRSLAARAELSRRGEASERERSQCR